MSFQVPETDLKKLLWFVSGFTVVLILSISYRFIPVTAAFGLLCFGTGVLLFQFLSLRRREKDLKDQVLESYKLWDKELKRLNEEDHKLEIQKNSWKAEKEQWEAYRNEWEADKEASVLAEVERMALHEPEKLINIQKGVLRIVEEEAARRGGEQIDRDMESDDDDGDVP